MIYVCGRRLNLELQDYNRITCVKWKFHGRNYGLRWPSVATRNARRLIKMRMAIVERVQNTYKGKI